MTEKILNISGHDVSIDENFSKILNAYNWHVYSLGTGKRKEYAVTKVFGVTVYMHRVIMEEHLGRKLDRSEEIDHIDGNSLNNTIKNLRVCSHKENTCNKSKFSTSSSEYMGVYYNDAYDDPYRAKIMKDGENIHIGGFKTPKEAAEARDIACLIHFGQFACLNFEHARSEYLQKINDGYNPIQPARETTSKYRGVSLQEGKWVARANNIYLGVFDSEESAAAQHDLAYLYINGDVKEGLNFPDKTPQYIKMLASGVIPVPEKQLPSTEYIGVSYNKDACKFAAYVGSGENRVYLGMFSTAKDAAETRDMAVIKLGIKSVLNFVSKEREYREKLRNGYNPIPIKVPKSSKYVGVCYTEGSDKWIAYTPLPNGKRFNIGAFETEDAAYEALCDTERRLTQWEYITDIKPRSNYRGVKNQPNGKFNAGIYHNGVDYSLGSYVTPEEAAQTYDIAVIYLGAEHWKLNFPNLTNEYRAKLQSGYVPIKEKRTKSSKHKGVSYRKDKKRWHAYTQVDGKRKNLGYFGTEQEAIQAYDKYITNQS